MQLKIVVMNRLYIFNPENDLALAVNSSFFTPPAAAVKLARSAACLPMWYADEGDYVLASGVDREWLERTSRVFDLNINVVAGAPAGVSDVVPWGWSRYARELFRRAGVSENLLPADVILDNYRYCSHRRISIEVYNNLTKANLPYPLPDFPVEVVSVEPIENNLAAGRHMFLKSPLSGSGRGVIDTTSAPARQSLRLAAGVIKHQGSIIIEPRLDKTADFAMLFDMVDGHARFAGYSSFFNAGYSTYSGNILMSDEQIVGMLCEKGIPRQWFDLTRSAVQNAIEQSIGSRYNGPLGVDMMVYDRDGEPCIAPCVEINLRMTMGRVAHILVERFLAAGGTGEMEIIRCATGSAVDDYEVVGGRLERGAVYLTPPGNGDFAVVMKTL